MPRVNVYIPDDLATELERFDALNVSAVCQNALREELAMRTPLADSEYDIFELDLRDDEERPYVGRLTAKQLGEDVYLTEQGNIVHHDVDKGRLDEAGDDDLLFFLGEATYIEVMSELGTTPVVDLDI